MPYKRCTFARSHGFKNTVIVATAIGQITIVLTIGRTIVKDIGRNIALAIDQATGRDIGRTLDTGNESTGDPIRAVIDSDWQNREENQINYEV